MKAIKDWLVSFFHREHVEEFDAASDPFVVKMRKERRESTKRRHDRRESWSERNALERELLGGGDR